MYNCKIFDTNISSSFFSSSYFFLYTMRDYRSYLFCWRCKLSWSDLSIADGNTVSLSGLSWSDSIYTADGTTGSNRAVAITDTLNFDSNTFVIDGTDNRVGIGTTAPTSKLHVEWWGISLDPVGSRTGQLFNGTSSQDGAEINTLAQGYAAFQRSDINANLSLSKNSSIGIGTGQFLNMVVDNTTIWRFETNGTHLGINASLWGNVGIGTSSPDDTLHVDGWSIRNSGSSPRLVLEDTDSSDFDVAGFRADIRAFDSDGDVAWTLGRSNNTVEDFRIVNNDVDGNIDFLIGPNTAATPDSRLHVNGKIRVAGESWVAISLPTNNAMRTDTIGGNFFFDVWNAIFRDGNGWVNNGNIYSDGLVVGAGAPFRGTTPPTRWALFEGNVGIGTADPQSRLSVVWLPSWTDDTVTPWTLAGAVCITNTWNMYIDTDGTCAN